MPTQEERNKVALEVARVKGFLDYNQLVQAHGVAQKIEGMVKDIMEKESKEGKIEEHDWWDTLRRARLLKEKIFKGNPKDNPMTNCPKCGEELPLDPGPALDMLSELGASI